MSDPCHKRGHGATMGNAATGELEKRHCADITDIKQSSTGLSCGPKFVAQKQISRSRSWDAL